MICDAYHALRAKQTPESADNRFDYPEKVEHPMDLFQSFQDGLALLVGCGLATAVATYFTGFVSKTMESGLLWYVLSPIIAAAAVWGLFVAVPVWHILFDDDSRAFLDATVPAVAYGTQIKLAFWGAVVGYGIGAGVVPELLKHLGLRY